MNSGWKACLIAGAILLCGFIVWIDVAARFEKRARQAEEARRVAIEKNRALIAAQAAAVKDGPGKSLNGTEPAKSSPGWKKPASAAFLETEARFANPKETPPPPSSDVVNFAAAPEKK